MLLDAERVVVETHEQYAQRVGAPVVGPCRIDLNTGTPGTHVWVCWTHDYRFTVRPYALDEYANIGHGYSEDGRHRLIDRCPMSRLEEWRRRLWDYQEWFD